MTTSLLTDAFDHNAWANLRVIDACGALSQAQLERDVPGTFGPILETLRHLVGADTAYLTVLTAGRVPLIEEEAMGLAELRAEAVRNGASWTDYLATNPDPDAVVVRVRDDGTESQAPVGIRLAQALHHGTDHRSQVCTALTILGVEPPGVDVWDMAFGQGRLVEVPPRA